MDNIAKASSKKFWVDWRNFSNEDFIKNYNEKGLKDIFSKVDVQYPKKLHGFYNYLPFLPETMKIEVWIANLHDKTEYVMNIRNLKEALNYGLVLKQLYKIIEFKQKVWLKS